MYVFEGFACGTNFHSLQDSAVRLIGMLYIVNHTETIIYPSASGKCLEDALDVQFSIRTKL